MAAVLAVLEPLGQQFDTLEKFIFDNVDPTGTVRAPTNGWPLTDLRYAGYIVLLYLGSLAVLSFIQSFKFMPKIDPYPLKFVYNLSQVMLCAYMTIEAGTVAYRSGYTLLPCNHFDTTNPPVLHVLYLFYLSKLWDFWDTLFMVLGKKWRQITFLHVYHHSSIWLFYWLNSRVNYDGDIYLTICLNGFIHTIMYTYYFVAMHTKVPTKWLSKEMKAKNPNRSVNLPIWWKSALTFNQIIQFCCMIGQALIMLKSECTMPHGLIIKVYVGYIITMLVLFMQFFIASYCGSSKQGKSKKA